MIYPIMGILAAFWFSRVTNHIFAVSKLDAVRFKSELETGQLVDLWVGNLILLAVTIGLATPWVMVRNARYRISKTTVLADNLDSFFAEQKDKSSALGEEIGGLRYRFGHMNRGIAGLWISGETTRATIAELRVVDQGLSFQTETKQFSLGPVRKKLKSPLGRNPSQNKLFQWFPF